MIRKNFTLNNVLVICIGLVGIGTIISKPINQTEAGTITKANIITNLQKDTSTLDTLDIMSEAFCIVESRNIENAYNKSSGASGVLQFKKIMVDEANRCENILQNTNDIQYYKYKDVWNKKKSKAMFKSVMKHRNKEKGLKKACIIWNYTHTKRYYDSVNYHYQKLLSITTK